MKLISFFICLLFSISDSFSQLHLENKTFTYDELIENYSNLDNQYPEARLVKFGQSDIGKPLHVFILSKEGASSNSEINDQNKSIILINNGIHAGEACGINASYELAKKLLSDRNELNRILDKTIILIIPIYNVGGMLYRNSFTRANQNGPESYGFRGNAKNLDLNRDFIKCDSKNALSFNQLFSAWDPDIFIDTHTTNGSDHQYTFTLIASQKDKLNPIISDFMYAEMVPSLFSSMKQKNMEITPYIYSMENSPDNGIKAFLETARYSSGYASLFDCFSFISEAHVYKSFKDRVIQTQEFLKILIDFGVNNQKEIKIARAKAREYEEQQSKFFLNWQLDSSKYEMLSFKGYETLRLKSKLTGQNMRFYDTSNPYHKDIKYYSSYKAKDSISKPAFYVIPQAYDQVIERLKWNNISLIKIKSDTLIEVSSYIITDYDSPPKPYEGHYLHSNIKLKIKKQTLAFYQGDFLVSCKQQNIRYIIETLEPKAEDSFFSWNFFDSNMQQKEWFSDYAFEPKAIQELIENPELKNKFETLKQQDKEFSSKNFAQLYFIYKNSKYFESSAFRYPIFRID